MTINPEIATPDADAVVETVTAEPELPATPDEVTLVVPVEAAEAKGGTPGKAKERGIRKTRRGYVTSDKMNKTIVVEVKERVKHPLYGKVISHRQKFKAHDELNEAGIGDLVEIMETRPLSRTKRWRLVQILEKAK